MLRFIPVLLACSWISLVGSQELFNAFDLLNLGNQNLMIPNIILPFIEQEALTIVAKIPEGQCKSDLLGVYKGLLDTQLWALKMLDSWAKPQTGLITGNIMHIGNYDECLEINTNSIQGQYCSVLISPINSGKFNITDILLNAVGDDIKQQLGEAGLIKLSFGICIPRSCTTTILRNISKMTNDHFELGINLDFQDVLCDYKREKEFPPIAIMGSAIFLLVITSVLFATVYDLATVQAKGRSPLLIALSAYSNSKEIFSGHKGDETISCLNGIKFISMFWIILGHKYMILPYVPYINTSHLTKWIENPLNMTVVAATFAVDTFFVISGLLVSYIYFKAESKNIKFNIIRYWFHRFVRLTPSLAALVLFLATVLQYIGDGPLWNVVLEISKSDCVHSWWAILLYVQNYVYPNHSCAAHAWYLAVDTQLYVLAPILLIPFAKWPKKTMSVIVLLTFASMSWAFVNSWSKDLDLMYYNESMNFHNFYISTHFRASSWLIGLIMGYTMFKIKTKKVSMNKILNLSLWFISILTMFAVIFGHFSFVANDHSRSRSTLFNTFSRPAWCLAICWIIFACSKGYGGVINKFLSLHIFAICARITYAIYLLHILQILYTVGTGRVAKYFSNQEELRVVWADFITTMFIAFIWTLLFELPAINLEKVILGPLKKKEVNNTAERIVENGNNKLSSE